MKSAKLVVDEKKLLKLFREWHYDSDGEDSEKRARQVARNYARRLMTRVKKEAAVSEQQIHPCKCTAYNRGQCYNCLNGAHHICSAKKKCGAPRAKEMGLKIVIEEHHVDDGEQIPFG